jgi:hypothetical protein
MLHVGDLLRWSSRPNKHSGSGKPLAVLYLANAKYRIELVEAVNLRFKSGLSSPDISHDIDIRNGI